jgi:citrate lyase subunit beta / citryl-CoA lyase
MTSSAELSVDLWRSWMFVPGSNPRFLAKAPTSGADALLVDLEDGVPPAEKAGARELVRAFLTEPAWSSDATACRRFVRTNSAGSGLLADDLAAVAVPGLEGVCLPKTESPDDVERLCAQLDELERDRGLAVGSIKVLAAIESARALLAAPQIAAGPRVIGLIFGAEDFAFDLGMRTDRRAEAADLSYARSAVVVAAASAGALSVDGVFPRLDDEAGLVDDVHRSRDLGFSGKSTFNPRQVATINAIFRPGPEDVEFSRAVVEEFARAVAEGAGAAVVRGQLVDRPIALRAERVLRAAAAAERRDSR